MAVSSPVKSFRSMAIAAGALSRARRMFYVRDLSLVLVIRDMEAALQAVDSRRLVDIAEPLRPDVDPQIKRLFPSQDWHMTTSINLIATVELPCQ
jgi:hypothetical protein